MTRNESSFVQNTNNEENEMDTMTAWERQASEWLTYEQEDEGVYIETDLAYEDIRWLLRRQMMLENWQNNLNGESVPEEFEDEKCFRDAEQLRHDFEWDTEKNLRDLIELIEMQKVFMDTNGTKIEWVKDAVWSYHENKQVRDEANAKQAEFRTIWNKLTPAQKSAKRVSYNAHMKKFKTIGYNAHRAAQKAWGLYEKAKARLGSVYENRWELKNLIDKTPGYVWAAYYRFLEEQDTPYHTCMDGMTDTTKELEFQDSVEWRTSNMDSNWWTSPYLETWTPADDSNKWHNFYKWEHSLAEKQMAPFAPIEAYNDVVE